MLQDWSRRPDHDTATAASIGQSLLRELDVIIAFLQRAGSGVLGESTIPMFDSSCAPPRGMRKRHGNHSIRSLAGPPANKIATRLISRE